MNAALHTERRPAATRVPEACEVSGVTPDERPCIVRYVAGGDVVSVWVPRFGATPSESVDRLGLVAREWLTWARAQAAKAEQVRS